MAEIRLPVVAPLDADGNKIINVGTPTANGDAATMAYVDTAVNGVDAIPVASGIQYVNQPAGALNTAQVSVPSGGLVKSNVVTGSYQDRLYQNITSRTFVVQSSGYISSIDPAPIAESTLEEGVTAGDFEIYVNAGRYDATNNPNGHLSPDDISDVIRDGDFTITNNAITSINVAGAAVAISGGDSFEHIDEVDHFREFSTTVTYNAGGSRTVLIIDNTIPSDFNLNAGNYELVSLNGDALDPTIDVVSQAPLANGTFREVVLAGVVPVGDINVGANTAIFRRDEVLTLDSQVDITSTRTRITGEIDVEGLTTTDPNRANALWLEDGTVQISGTTGYRLNTLEELQNVRPTEQLLNVVFDATSALHFTYTTPTTDFKFDARDYDIITVGTTSLGTSPVRVTNRTGDNYQIASALPGVSAGDTVNLTIQKRTAATFLEVEASITEFDGDLDLLGTRIHAPNLPTSDPGILGVLWLDEGVVVTSGETNVESVELPAGSPVRFQSRVATSGRLLPFDATVTTANPDIFNEYESRLTYDFVGTITQSSTDIDQLAVTVLGTPTEIGSVQGEIHNDLMGYVIHENGDTYFLANPTRVGSTEVYNFDVVSVGGGSFAEVFRDITTAVTWSGEYTIYLASEVAPYLNVTRNQEARWDAAAARTPLEIIETHATVGLTSTTVGAPDTLFSFTPRTTDGTNNVDAGIRISFNNTSVVPSVVLRIADTHSILSMNVSDDDISDLRVGDRYFFSDGDTFALGHVITDTEADSTHGFGRYQAAETGNIVHLYLDDVASNVVANIGTVGVDRFSINRHNQNIETEYGWFFQSQVVNGITYSTTSVDAFRFYAIDTNDQFVLKLGSQEVILDHVDGVISSGVTIQEDGAPLTTDATTLNFAGAGVTAAGTGTTKTITIASTGGADVIEEHNTIPVTNTGDSAFTLNNWNIVIGTGGGFLFRLERPAGNSETIDTTVIDDGDPILITFADGTTATANPFAAGAHTSTLLFGRFDVASTEPEGTVLVATTVHYHDDAAVSLEYVASPLTVVSDNVFYGGSELATMADLTNAGQGVTIAGGTFVDGEYISSVTETNNTITFVKRTWENAGIDLTDIADVTISGTLSDNQVLAYDTTTSLWIPQTIGSDGLNIDGDVTVDGNLNGVPSGILGKVVLFLGTAAAATTATVGTFTNTPVTSYTTNGVAWYYFSGLRLTSGVITDTAADGETLGMWSNHATADTTITTTINFNLIG